MPTSNRSFNVPAGAMALGLAIALAGFSGSAQAAAGAGGGGGGGATGGTDVVVSVDRGGNPPAGGRGNQGILDDIRDQIFGDSAPVPVDDLTPGVVVPGTPAGQTSSGAREFRQRCVQYRYQPDGRIACERVARR